jgi:hypothetical protein
MTRPMKNKVLRTELGIVEEEAASFVAVEAARYEDAVNATAPSILPQYAIDPADYLPASDFDAGTEVFYRSEDPTEVLDAKTDRTKRHTRIWWRATVALADEEDWDENPLAWH